MNSYFKFAMTAIAAMYAYTASAQDYSICAAPLNSALMTVNINTASESSKDAFLSWQCSFKFSSHGDAINAGLSIGTVIYGSPLQIGGTFDQNKVSAWKEENCSKNAQNSSFQGATLRYLKEVAPGAMEAYATCIDALSSNGALQCDLTGDPAAFSIRWKRTTGEALDAAPVIKRFMTVNGTCTPGLETGSQIGDGAVGTPCIADHKKDLMVMVETTRGLCTGVLKAKKETYTIAGEVSLNSDRTISADIVKFEDGARVILNGYALKLTAEEIRLRGAAGVYGFKKEIKLDAGASGISGGTLLLTTNTITGGDLTIDLSGQDGQKGFTGTSGTQGAQGHPAKGRGLQGLRGCGGGHDAGQGGRGTDGQPGGPGGAGGNGGTAVIRLESTDDSALSRLIIIGKDGKTFGGKGGIGGDGGTGGAGGLGGFGDSGHDGCGGRGGGPAGPAGSPGNPGLSGNDGTPGTIAIERKT